MDTKVASGMTNSNAAQYETIEKYMVPLSNIVTFKPDQPIQEVIATIINKKIAGAPVLDDQNRLVGMISEKDCLRLIVDQAYYNMPAETRKVSDYMTPKVQTLSPKTTILEAAVEFLNSPIRRFPVVENGMIIGQVSRRHILRAAQDLQSAAR
ncbi:MAG TPA: CBS domain-containing protein [Cyclobacteriaceae bacterium]|nr:CBS domain-containing protein [Cyclobacteriaceae bacterium]